MSGWKLLPTRYGSGPPTSATRTPPSWPPTTHWRAKAETGRKGRPRDHRVAVRRGLPRLRRPTAGNQHVPTAPATRMPRLRLPHHLDHHRSRRQGDRMTQPTTRAERLAAPLARDVVRQLAIDHGGCIRPIQIRKTNLATGQEEQILVPCGHTLAT